MKIPVSRFVVHGNSMAPALREGQDILSFNWAYLIKKPKAGDIVVIKVNGKEMVKRIQSIFGQNIFVVGDNTKESTDSREFGSITKDSLIGKVVCS